MCLIKPPPLGGAILAGMTGKGRVCAFMTLRLTSEPRFFIGTKVSNPSMGSLFCFIIGLSVFYQHFF